MRCPFCDKTDPVVREIFVKEYPDGIPNQRIGYECWPFLSGCGAMWRQEDPTVNLTRILEPVDVEPVELGLENDVVDLDTADPEDANPDG